MAGSDPRDECVLRVVARGPGSRLEVLRELLAELAGVDVIEDRRDGSSRLRRVDREDTLCLA